MKRSFDNLAKAYSGLERLMFGRQLESSRRHGLAALDFNRSQRCLVLGSGDGRFSSIALKETPLLQIDSIERSPKMREQAQLRIQKLGKACASRHHYVANDARHFSFPESEYDVVIAQFFLDCFDTTGANDLLSKSARTLRPNGKLVYADFSIPNKIPARWIGNGVVSLLYLFFRLTTDIETSRLPTLVWPDSLELISKKTRLKGLLTSTISTKSAD